jgi:hypothetical protein
MDKREEVLDALDNDEEARKQLRYLLYQRLNDKQFKEYLINLKTIHAINGNTEEIKEEIRKIKERFKEK